MNKTTDRGPKIREIVTTTDFSAAARAGTECALTLGRKLGAAVTLLHVIEPPSRISGMEAVPLARTDSEMASMARTQLDRLAAMQTEGTERVTCSIRTGKAFHEIIEAARQKAADLIVIATHGHTGAKRVIFGSTAERVVRHARCPVLTVPAAGPKESRSNFQKILVPIDFSTVSKDALPWAISLARHFGGEIKLLHVVETPAAEYFESRDMMRKTLRTAVARAEADLKHLAGHVGKSTGLKVSSIVRSGAPYEEICHGAETLKANLIVITTHGYTGMKHVWLGSAAERVVRHAKCPVLVVRRRDRKAL